MINLPPYLGMINLPPYLLSTCFVTCNTSPSPFHKSLTPPLQISCNLDLLTDTDFSTIMASLQQSKIPFLCLLFIFFFASTLVCENQPKKFEILGTRRMLSEMQDEDEPTIIKKKTTPTATKNQTKIVKPAPKNQTKLIKSTNTTALLKSQAKVAKLFSDSSNSKTKIAKVQILDPVTDSGTTSLKSQLQKLNSTSKKASSNSTTAKGSSLLTMKSSDLPSSKNKTTKETKAELEIEPKSKISGKDQPNKAQKQPSPSWLDQDDDDDLVSEFRELPSRFQENIMPDLEKISKTSQVYLTKYNKEFTKGFKPYVGNKYAPTIASLVSFAFVLIPFIVVSLIFNRIKAYFSLQKLLIFIQIYLSIYFTILCLSSLVTGLEPLKFFYATSRSTYVCVQVLQTLGYVLYLLLLLMYLILVFSTETGLGTKMLGLGQTFVGFAVGLHYYMAVFHRAVLHQPPKTSWKVHSLYATFFLVICLFSRVDWRKKAYYGEEGKKS